MTRIDGRNTDQLRQIKITEDFVSTAEASYLIEVGKTRILCCASLEDEVPRWMKGKGKGWVTAEYNLLPRSTTSRVKRERAGASGRTQEIQRLIGRSLRAIIDLEKLGERSIHLDCDVIQADGGTRTAAITGAYVALHDAVSILLQSGKITENPLKQAVAAISVGAYKGTPVLDLDYIEDSDCDTDMNVVMTTDGGFVEIQGTAEGEPFNRDAMNAMLDLAASGIGELLAMQVQALKEN